MSSIPMSVRISEEDQEFIAALEVPGAKTPSEKIRAIIAEVREHRQGLNDPVRCADLVREMLTGPRRRLRDAEKALRVHSELLTVVHEWLPELFSLVSAWPYSEGTPPSENDLAQLEDRTAAHVFRLIEGVLLMGITARCRCYDPGLVVSRLDRVLEITRMIERKEEE